MADPTSDKPAEGAPNAPTKRRFTGDPSSLPRPKSPDHAPSEVANTPASSAQALDQPATSKIDLAGTAQTHQAPPQDNPERSVKPRVKQKRRRAHTRSTLSNKRQRHAPVRKRPPSHARVQKTTRPRPRKRAHAFVDTVMAFVLPLMRFLHALGRGVAFIWRKAGQVDQYLWGHAKAVLSIIDRAVTLCADWILGALKGFFIWLPTRAGRGYCAFFGVVMAISGLWIADEIRSTSAKAGSASAANAAAISPFASSDPVLARLDGDYIRLSDVEVAARLSGTLAEDETLLAGSEKTRELLNGLIDQRLLARAALESGIDRDADLSAQLKVARERLLASAFLERKIAQTVTPQKVKKLYAAQADTTALGEEIRARHILVATRAEAIEIITKIDRGADFSTLARARSLDRGTAVHGGDMGFISRDMVSDEFSRIAFTVDEGALSLPFRTEEGWNVIEVLEKRTTEPVAFDSVEEDLARFLELRTIDKTLNQLREAYDVVVLAPPKPSAENPAN